MKQRQSGPRKNFRRSPSDSAHGRMTIRELRRMGGLLKQHFSTMREAKASPYFLLLHEKLLQTIRQKIDAIGTTTHDREEDQK